ncbi:exodeoxyribonuclease V subunit alpha [Gallibacterium anatis]|uniref:exodeoxyribonuclease V subunit alpha n=2 Tax=Gallibacterium anatis TaxID=750 RepID=UPI003005256D
MMLALLQQLRDQKLIENIDYYFADYIARQGQSQTEAINDLAALFAALLSFANQQGHSCLFLTKNVLENPFELKYQPEQQALLQQIEDLLAPYDVKALLANLVQHPAFSMNDQQNTPIVCKKIGEIDALYFHRIWQDEHYIAARLSESRSIHYQQNELTDLKRILQALFPHSQHLPDWQKIAVATAFSSTISFISGGPGTGKTTTVAKLLLGLQWLQQIRKQPWLNIRLAAPTGKAATRLTESLHQAIQNIHLPLDLSSTLPQEAATIHRLLGMRPNSPPRYHQQQPLNIDVLVIDEASMINLALMATLLRGIKPSTKLIFLGDKDQLASVESGAIMAELGQFLSFDYSRQQAAFLATVCEQQLAFSNELNFIRDSLCHLQHSYRFNQNTGIGQLAKAVNQRQAEESWQLFAEYDDIRVLPLFRPGEANNQQVVDFAVQLYSDYFKFVQSEKNWQPEAVAKAFMLFKQARLLSALRNGQFGVEQLNQRIAEQLRRKKYIRFQHAHEWYLGKPVIILQNDNNSRLFNGDIGLVLPDKNGDLKVWFEAEQGFREVLSSRVPSVEPAYVMTVHKSQGSEFTRTVLVLPAEYNPLLSKELIYTAITRAKQAFTVFSREAIWKAAVRTQTQRYSGLAQQIKQIFKEKESEDVIKGNSGIE